MQTLNTTQYTVNTLVYSTYSARNVFLKNLEVRGATAPIARSHTL